MSDMTIRDVRTILVRVPWTDAPHFGKTRVTAPRDILVVEIETASGIVGLGYLHLLSPSLRTIATCLDEAIVPLLKGRDATAIEAIWRDLWQATYSAGRMGVAVMAISAVDIALWDAVGKRANLPLHRLWGHFRSTIPAYGSGCWRGLGGDGMIEKASVTSRRATRRSRCRSPMSTTATPTSPMSGGCARRWGRASRS